MSVNTPEYVHNYVNAMAGDTRRQMPVFSHVGKGIQGNSFKIVLDTSDNNVKLNGIRHDELNDQDIIDWTLSLSAFTPVLHYELWTGVRVIDEEMCYVYWYKIKAVTTVGSTNVTLWEFTTPTVKRFVYDSEEEPPADTKIDEG